MLVVIDTNILVSSLWSREGKPARVMSMVLNGRFVPCYDYRILTEYRAGLKSPKFGFSGADMTALLDLIENNGHSVVVEPLDDVFIDEDDKKFYEVAKYCQAKLITGNVKHYPKDPLVMTVGEFLEQF